MTLIKKLMSLNKDNYCIDIFDECPICLEIIYDKNIINLYCCKKYIHKKCLLLLFLNDYKCCCLCRQDQDLQMYYNEEYLLDIMNSSLDIIVNVPIEKDKKKIEMLLFKLTNNIKYDRTFKPFLIKYIFILCSIVSFYFVLFSLMKLEKENINPISTNKISLMPEMD